MGMFGYPRQGLLGAGQRPGLLGLQPWQLAQLAAMHGQQQPQIPQPQIQQPSPVTQPGASPAQGTTAPPAGDASGPQPFNYQMMDQTTGKPFTFGASSTPSAATQSGIDPNTGAPYAGGDNSADRTQGPPQGSIEGANFGNAGSWGSRAGGAAGLFAGPVGMALGPIGNAIGNYSDYQAAKSVAQNMGLDENSLDPTSAFVSNTMLGNFLGQSFPEQVEAMQQAQMEQAGKDIMDGKGAAGLGMGGSGGNAVSGPAGDIGFHKGGLVTSAGLLGPNPPGPDEGFGALKPGERVVTAANWKKLPKKARLIAGGR